MTFQYFHICTIIYNFFEATTHVIITFIGMYCFFHLSFQIFRYLESKMAAKYDNPADTACYSGTYTGFVCLYYFAS